MNPVSIEPVVWSKLHGAATHFPIALVLVAALCDTLSHLPLGADSRRALRSTAGVSLVLGALGSYAAVLSGLLMTRWQVWGNAAMLRHHQFAWPAFALVTALAAWRIVTRQANSQAPGIGYSCVLILTSVLIGAAGYWGGELLNRG